MAAETGLSASQQPIPKGINPHAFAFYEEATCRLRQLPEEEGAKIISPIMLKNLGRIFAGDKPSDIARAQGRTTHSQIVTFNEQVRIAFQRFVQAYPDLQETYFPDGNIRYSTAGRHTSRRPAARIIAKKEQTPKAHPAKRRLSSPVAKTSKTTEVLLQSLASAKQPENDPTRQEAYRIGRTVLMGGIISMDGSVVGSKEDVEQFLTTHQFTKNHVQANNTTPILCIFDGGEKFLFIANPESLSDETGTSGEYIVMYTKELLLALRAMYKRLQDGITPAIFNQQKSEAPQTSLLEEFGFE